MNTLNKRKKSKQTKNFNIHTINKINKLNKERLKLDKLLASNLITNLVRDRFTRRIHIINKEIEDVYEKEKRRIEEKAIDDLAGDLKAFYNYANSFRKSKIRVGPLKSGGSYHSGEREMANILSRQYKSVFSVPSDGSYSFKKQIECRLIQDIVLTAEEFEEAMKSMKASSAPGPDGIPAFFFKYLAKELSYPLMKIWRRCLDAGKMPQGPIKAIITPIFKSDDKSEPANYRPVSLTNHITKVFERVVRKHLVHHLESQDLMNKSQHGFRDGLSTITELLSYYDSILSKMEEGHAVHAIYLDFAKAFDKSTIRSY